MTVALARRAPWDKAGWAASALLLVVVVLAVFAPLLAPYDPNQGVLLDAFEGPSAAHWLGTDAVGRDIFSRLIHGAQTSLLGPLAIVGLSLVISLPLGLAAAWYGGAVSFAVTRTLDIVFAIPGLLLAILVVSLFGPGLWAAALALGVAYVPYVARMIVAATERERRLPYVHALSIQGHSVLRIVVRHLLPNLAPVIAGQATITFAYSLIDLAGLSFLGLAVQAPQADWGVLVSDQDAVLQGHPGQAIVAGVAIVLTVLSLFVVGTRLAGERPKRFRKG